MKLRNWQSQAIKTALCKFASGEQHFLCLATPGSGKTFMASVLAKRLMDENKVDLVLCFSPSVNVSTTFQSSLEAHLGCRLDGLLGSKGHVLTYQSMLNLDSSFWALLSQHRTLVIFDEIHHCSGDRMENANAWGQKVIEHIQNSATYTLALTGTPWRSDKIPIAISRYSRHGKIQCDFTYGLAESIKDHVCRTPKIIAVDNGNIRLNIDGEEKNYSSFSDLLTHSDCSYQQLIDNASLIKYMLESTQKKLNKVRKKQPDAGALIVAASVDHALKIAHILESQLGEKAFIATYMHDDAQDIIDRFRNDNEKWIISVGMISEGTDIPRLKVCCHLTRVKTELHFRQVLGRILRSQGNKNDEGFLFVPAEPNLIEYAKRVAEDIPDANAISLESMEMGTTIDIISDEQPELTDTSTDDSTIEEIRFPTPVISLLNTDADLTSTNTYFGPTLSEGYESSIDFFGRFNQQIISSNLNYC